MIGLYYAGLTNRPLLLFLQLAILVLGIRLIVKARERLVSYISGLARPLPRYTVLLSALWLGAFLLYAAHPQRLYDQLSYHLVIAKRLLTLGNPFGHDSHLWIAGPVEFAFVWHRNLLPDDLMQIALAQSAVYLAAVGGMLAAFFLGVEHAGRRYSKRTLPLLVLATIMTLPVFIPNSEAVNIAKPGAILMAGCALMLALTARKQIQWLPIAIFMSLVFISTKATFLHAAIAGLSLLTFRGLRRGLDAYHPGLFVLGGLCLVATVAKNFFETGHFLYPADGRFIQSVFSDLRTVEYWQNIAFGKTEGGLHAWLGPFHLMKRNPAALAWLVVLGVTAIVARVNLNTATKSILLFLACYTLLWPVFYSEHIYSRFVAPAVGALLLLGCQLLAAAPPRMHLSLITLSILLALSVSQLEVVATKIYKWNKSTSHAAFYSQYPRIETARQLASLNINGNLLIADDTAKFFFNKPVLHGTLIPRERQLWQQFLADPSKAARTHKLSAMIRRAPDSRSAQSSDPFLGPIGEVWNQLHQRGQVLRVGQDEILYSYCFFKEPNCKVQAALPLEPARFL